MHFWWDCIAKSASLEGYSTARAKEAEEEGKKTNWGLFAITAHAAADAISRCKEVLVRKLRPARQGYGG